MSLLDDLSRHRTDDALEAEHLARILEFVAGHPAPFDRSTTGRHLTASAVVVSAQGERVLLVHHRKLDRWLQPGGHAAPGESSGEIVALREAIEESGLRGLELHPVAPRPLDVDVHRIPATAEGPAHDHLDLRYLLVAPAGASVEACALETRGARWFTWDELEEIGADLPMRRLFAKARRWVTGGSARVRADSSASA